MAWNTKYRLEFDEQAGIPQGKSPTTATAKVDLNGSTGKIVIPNSSVLNPGSSAISFSFGFNMDDATGFRILSKDNGSNWDYVIGVGGTDKLHAIFRDQSTNGYRGRQTPVMTANENENLIGFVTYDGGTLSSGVSISIYNEAGSLLFSDDSNSESGTFIEVEDNSYDLNIGARLSASSYADGEFWGVRVHDVELSAGQITTLLAGGDSGNEVANYAINEGAGTNIVDSVSANDGTLSGGYTWSGVAGDPGYVQKSWKVDILEDGYAGAVVELEGTANPLTVQWDGSGTDAFGVEDETSVIKPSRAVLNIYSTQDQYSDLWDVTSNFTHKMEVYEDGSLYWTGYVNPDKWSEKYTNGSFPIQIIATDGLEKLTEIDYPVGTSRVSGFKIIRNCLDTLNLDLGYLTNTYLYDRQDSSPSGFVLEQLYWNESSFTDVTGGDTQQMDFTNFVGNGRGSRWIPRDLPEHRKFVLVQAPIESTQKKAYEVLLGILKSFGLRLFQRRGVWNIREVYQHDDVLQNNTYTYSLTGASATPIAEPTYVSLAGASTSDPIIFQGNISVIKPLKKLTINYNGHPAINYCAGGEFDLPVWNYAGTDFSSAQWSKYGAVTISRLTSTLTDDASGTGYAVKLTSVGPTTGTADYIYNKGQRVKKDDTFWFEFRYKADITSGSGTEPQIGYALRVDMPNGEYREGAGTSWVYSDGSIWTSVVPDAHNIWQRTGGTFTVPEDGILSVKLFEIVEGGYTATGVTFDRFIIEQTTTNGIQSKQFYTEGRDNESYKYEIENSQEFTEEMEMSFSNSDRATRGRAIYQDAQVSYIKLNLKFPTLIHNTSAITLDISGVAQTYTYVSSGYAFMSDEFTTIDDLIAEIEYDDGSSEYQVWKEASGSNWFLHIEGIDYDAGLDFGTATHADSQTSTVTETNAVNPTTITAWQTEGDVMGSTVSGADYGSWVLESQQYPRPEAIGRQIMNARSKFTTKLRGTLIDYTKSVDVGSVIYDSHGGRYYWINQFLVSCKTGDINIDAIEMDQTLVGTLTVTKTVL